MGRPTRGPAGSEQVALAHRRTPGGFIGPARQVAVSHRLTARCQSGGVGAAPSTV